MLNNDVYISVAGVKYSKWKSCKIIQSLETLASSFELNVSDAPEPGSNDDWPLRTQQECIIYIGKDKLIRGYIDTVHCSINKDEHTVTISGRDRTADIVDCSYVEKQTSWSKITLLSLANILLKPFNLTAKLDKGVSDTRSFQFSLNTGETIFNNLVKKAKNFGILLITNNNGELLLTNSGNEKAYDALTLNANILRANVSYSYIDRFSEYIVYTQIPSKESKGKWKTNISIKVQSTDTGVLRYRPKLIKSTSPLSRSGAQEFANWTAQTRAAASQEATIVVQGFRQSNGNLWKVNQLVDIYAPALYINPATEMLISSIEYDLNAEGTFTKLGLKRKDAYKEQPEESKEIKAAPSLGWNKLKRVAISLMDNE